MPDQRGLLEQDIVRLMAERDACQTRLAEAIQARSRAKECVYAAEAAMDHARLDDTRLAMQIDEQLDALHRLPAQRESS